MDKFDIEKCLESMEILVDTREHRTKKAFIRYDSFGCPYKFCHLDYGDYTFNFTLPDGKALYQINDSVIKPCVSIERKQSLTEISGNLCQHKKRFEAEFERAKESKAKVYLIIEKDNIGKLYAGHYGTNFHPHAFTASLWAVIARHNLSGPIFIPESLSGKIIHDILYRELKARLERGEFD